MVCLLAAGDFGHGEMAVGSSSSSTVSSFGTGSGNGSEALTEDELDSEASVLHDEAPMKQAAKELPDTDLVLLTTSATHVYVAVANLDGISETPEISMTDLCRQHSTKVVVFTNLAGCGTLLTLRSTSPHAV